MKEKIFKKLEELYKLLLQRADWSGERSIIRRSKQGLALSWIVYFLLREELVKEILRPVSNHLINFPYIQWIYSNRVSLLLIFTFLLIVSKFVFCILRWGKFITYSHLDKEDYPEYNFSFQKELVSFLNQKEERGRNIFWLNGAWGSGKTHFIRTFFEEQRFKPREIYYISCFGIQTREQAERILVEEIEQHSTFGSLDHIPVVSSLVKWSYKILGLDLIKKHSLIIFDDLERVAYSEKEKDNPENYNDLLGFIDYLGNHRNQKVIVLMNQDDMENTYQKIIDEKFKPILTNIPNQEQIIEMMTEGYNNEIRDLIKNIYLFQHEFNSVNLRSIPFMAKKLDEALQGDLHSKMLVKILNNQIRKDMDYIIKKTSFRDVAFFYLDDQDWGIAAEDSEFNDDIYIA